MLLRTVRIRNFRTISEEIIFNVDRKCALIGANNAGKTNVLKAIYLFFCSYKGTLTNRPINYTSDKDFPRFVESGRTTINVFLECESSETDDQIKEQYDKIKFLLKLPVGTSRIISILLTFSDIGNPIFQIFPTTKRPSANEDVNELNIAIDNLFHIIFSNLAVHYIQSDKRFGEIYSELLLPSVKKEIAVSFDEIYNSVKSRIDLVNQEINQYMRMIDLGNFTIKLSAPDDIASFIKDIEFRLQDEIESDLDSKGMGIQALAMTASMLWLQRFYRRNEKSTIWLIEEPESYLHPSLISAQSKIIDKLSENSSVIYATHALGFVPAGRNKMYGVQKTGNTTKLVEYSSTFEATSSLRKNLGVKFSDYFQLNQITIAVEGPTDSEYIGWFLKKYNSKIASKEHQWPLLRSASLLDYGGVKNMQSFIQATFEHIRKESVYVALFDSDRAGQDARTQLQRYFGNKNIGFESNKDFVSVRYGFAIEGLFSDDVITSVHQQNSLIFELFSTDSEGTLEPFRIKDNHKNTAFKLLTLEADRHEGMKGVQRFIGLCNALEKSIEIQQSRLNQ